MRWKHFYSVCVRAFVPWVHGQLSARDFSLTLLCFRRSFQHSQSHNVAFCHLWQSQHCLQRKVSYFNSRNCSGSQCGALCSSAVFLFLPAGCFLILDDDVKEFSQESVFCFQSSVSAEGNSRFLDLLFGNLEKWVAPPIFAPLEALAWPNAVFVLQHVTSAETQACLESPGVRPRPLCACSLARSLSQTRSHFRFTFLPVKTTHTDSGAVLGQNVGVHASPCRPSCAPRAWRAHCRSAYWVKCVSPPWFN